MRWLKRAHPKTMAIQCSVRPNLVRVSFQPCLWVCPSITAAHRRPERLCEFSLLCFLVHFDHHIGSLVSPGDERTFASKPSLSMKGVKDSAECWVKPQSEQHKSQQGGQDFLGVFPVCSQDTPKLAQLRPTSLSPVA